jgi:hypothetical protein
MLQALDLFPPGVEIAALPGWSHPRLLFPASGGMRCRWRATAHYPAFRLSARWLRLLLRAAGTARIACTCRRPSGRWSLGELVAPAVPEVAHVLILPGTRNTIQKATAVLLTRHYEVAGFAKCAFLPAAVERLRNESAVLTRLAAGLAPELLTRGKLQPGGEALVLEAVAGKHLRAKGSSPPGKALELLDRLVLTAPMDIGAHPWFRQNADGIGLLARAQDALAERHWPAVIEHGDFAPWNLLATRDGIMAIDWEHANLQSFPLLDAMHYFFQTSALLFRRGPQRAAGKAVQYLVANQGLRQSESWAIVLMAAYNDLKKGHADGMSPSEPLQVWRRTLLEVSALAMGSKRDVGPLLEPIWAGWPRLGQCAS